MESILASPALAHFQRSNSLKPLPVYLVEKLQVTDSPTCDPQPIASSCP